MYFLYINKKKKILELFLKKISICTCLANNIYIYIYIYISLKKYKKNSC
ncbi:MAG: hypothetical protein MCS20_01990 [Candidatus Phytoplasma mali]|nr:hypothetical protein [Candidatus Phytoplasma mali]